jgi:hypothetical protein
VTHIAGRMAAVSLILLAACSGAGKPAVGQGAGAPGETSDFGYLSPPAATAVSVEGGGALAVTGRAQPGARVQFTAIPSRAQLVAVADASGAWRLSLPPAPQVRMYGLAATAAGRTVQSEGWLAVTPDGHAAQLRAGAGATLVSPASSAPHILAVDLDRDGSAVVSGIAKAGAGLAIRIDRSPQGDVKAGADGRFAFPLRNLRGGSHLIDVAGEGGVDAVQVTAAGPAGVGVFAGAPTPQGWRIDWTTPGGGAQATLLITRWGAGS